MKWAKNPFCLMGVLNCTTGLFSALAGLGKLEDQNIDATLFDTSNPWLYVSGGLFTILLGVGNWFQLKVATHLTILMIVCSLYNGWFGAGSHDWRFWTLNAYSFAMFGLVVWSFRSTSEAAGHGR